jgi:hypothetical protein
MAELPKAAQGTFDELLEGLEPDLAALAALAGHNPGRRRAHG